MLENKQINLVVALEELQVEFDRLLAHQYVS
jgi:hypothetical protein